MNDLIGREANALDELDSIGNETLRLKDVDFTDLLVSETGEFQIRGLQDAEGPLVDLPMGFLGDADRVQRIVASRGQLEGEFSFDHDGVRYRATKIEGQEGIWYALRRLMFPIPRLSKLGINPLIVREIGRLGPRPGRGLILVAGATGNGKTTTVCSILQEFLWAYGDMAVTIEDPPELKLEGKHGAFGFCVQNKVRDGNFAAPLRSVLRQNPRYIFIGEIRDPETASEALRAANSGHLVLSTIHAGSVRESITTMMKYVSSRLDIELARQMIGDGLSAVLHQEMRTIRAGDGRTTRRIAIRSLFLDDEGIRSKIRGGQTNMIDTDVERQAARVAQRKSPIGND